MSPGNRIDQAMIDDGAIGGQSHDMIRAMSTCAPIHSIENVLVRSPIDSVPFGLYHPLDGIVALVDTGRNHDPVDARPGYPFDLPQENRTPKDVLEHFTGEA